MGKVRVAVLGSQEEKEQRRRADARRQTKKSKKEKVEGVGLKGGERIAVMDGGELKPEYKKLVDEVEGGIPGESTEKKKAKTKKSKIRTRSKRYQDAARHIEKGKLYPLADAITLVKKSSITRFDGTVELHMNLNPESLDGKKELRGSVILPHGSGKKVRVAIADEALIALVEAGKIEFDMLVAHPEIMPKLAKVARILGPKGLMPNPKDKTITEDPEKRAKELSQGHVNFRTEPDQPIVHLPVGKVSFAGEKILENIEAVFEAIGRNKITKATLASTMGPGIKIDYSPTS